MLIFNVDARWMPGTTARAYLPLHPTMETRCNIVTNCSHVAYFYIFSTAFYCLAVLYHMISCMFSSFFESIDKKAIRKLRSSLYLSYLESVFQCRTKVIWKPRRSKCKTFKVRELEKKFTIRSSGSLGVSSNLFYRFQTQIWLLVINKPIISRLYVSNGDYNKWILHAKSCLP